ncbi:hypothetical protein F1734_25855 (plasmid) [Rhodococcus ruber]|uniref:relaxase/mobilization nuclease domain-containing protein n=1 Tax=Rhodococcus ruber TaxID=1830 RepID=UPI001931CF73|nr:hypothetical protein [Rhodococcus ruber]QRE83807.1 hypothetical protein F1734_25855 [Rhodococcus ruber]
MAQTVAERMGFATHPWVAVRHDDDHIHLAVSRVDFVGGAQGNRIRGFYQQNRIMIGDPFYVS